MKRMNKVVTVLEGRERERVKNVKREKQRLVKMSMRNLHGGFGLYKRFNEYGYARYFTDSFFLFTFFIL